MPTGVQPRAYALDPASESGKTEEDRSYEGGMELASPSDETLATGALHGERPDQVYEQPPQSLHVTPSKSGAQRIPFVQMELPEPTGTGVRSLEMSDSGTFCSLKKADALPGLEGHVLGSCGHVLLQRLLEVLSLRSQPRGKRDKRSLFPLPTSREVLVAVACDLLEDEISWMIAVCVSLNSLWGDVLFYDGLPNKGQELCLAEIKDQVRRFCGMKAVIEDLDWDAFFKVKSVGYQGDEVKLARWFDWSNIAPALPPEIGKVPLEDVCTLGCRHYVGCFDQFLKPCEDWTVVRAPRVMVDDSSWGAVCTGLIDAGVCVLLEASEVFHVNDVPLLNGLFGVPKDETTADGTEVFRLIMNMTPLNALCMPMSGDIDTLPSWGAMSPFFLQPSECLLISSEDVKCFFYTMKVPSCWWKFLAFNKPVPDTVLPEHLRGRVVYLASQVLPMGFLNSVSLAQHVHRNLVSWSAGASCGQNESHLELRKDRPFTSGNPNWRVYLDNYDLLERVQSTQMVDMEGTVAPGVLALRNEYERWDVPRHPKKAVARSPKCEVQGATVDGVDGVAYPREAKLCRYFSLALKLVMQTAGTQKQWQVVCGGLVYFSMFRRPLLSGLNAVWRHIESFNAGPEHVRVSPHDCKLEVLRFLGLLPLARMDFRLDMHPLVTCSDASSGGGGLCATAGTTPMGHAIASGALRGDHPEPRMDGGILAIGLFDGIGALRVALDTLMILVIGYISVEKHEPARRVVERHFPGVVHYSQVEHITAEVVRGWAAHFSQACVVLIGAGPPCQGVSGLNFDRKGALKDQRSCLFQEVPRIRDEVKRQFVWCPTYVLMESVATMDVRDREIMSSAIGCAPLQCDAGSFTWCHRPRLFWCDWEIMESTGFALEEPGDGRPVVLTLDGNQPLHEVVRSGWYKVEPLKSFPTFTTSRPSLVPGRKPAGVKQCSLTELARWGVDRHRFPPINIAIATAS